VRTGEVERKKMKLVSVGSIYGEANYHLQFTPKYRRDVFVDEVGEGTLQGELNTGRHQTTSRRGWKRSNGKQTSLSDFA